MIRFQAGVAIFTFVSITYFTVYFYKQVVCKTTEGVKQSEDARISRGVIGNNKQIITD